MQVPVYPALLEVMDKEVTVPEMWIWAVCLGSIAYAVARWRRWTVIPILLGQGVGVWAALSEWRDPWVGPAMLREAGPFWPWHLYASSAVVVLMALLGTFKSRT